MLNVLVAVLVQIPAADSLRPAFLRVERLLARGETEVALREARALAEMHPTSADAHALAGDAAGAAAGRANVFRIIGLARECARQYREAIRLDSANLRAIEGLIGYHIQAPRILGGDRGLALELSERLEQIDRARGLIARAFVLRLKGDGHADSDSLVEAALALDRDSVVLDRGAEYFTATGRHGRAALLLAQRLARDSAAVPAAFALAAASLRAGDTIGGLSVLAHAWRVARAAGDTAWIVPDRVAWRIAQVAGRRGDSAAMRAWTDSVLSVAPTHAGARALRDSLRRNR